MTFQKNAWQLNSLTLTMSISKTDIYCGLLDIITLPKQLSKSSHFRKEIAVKCTIPYIYNCIQSEQHENMDTNPYGMGRQVARLLMSTWTWTDFPSCMMCQPNLNNIDLWISLFIFIIYFSFLFAILILLLFSVKCLTTFERKTSQHNNVEIVQLLKNNKEPE